MYVGGEAGYNGDVGRKKKKKPVRKPLFVPIVITANRKTCVFIGKNDTSLGGRSLRHPRSSQNCTPPRLSPQNFNRYFVSRYRGRQKSFHSRFDGNGFSVKVDDFSGSIELKGLLKHTVVHVIRCGTRRAED